MSSVVAQMDAVNLNSGRGDDNDEDEDDLGANVNGSPKDNRERDAQGDPKNVGVLTLHSLYSTRNFYIQHPSTLLSGNISRPLFSVSELSSPCTLFVPLT